MISQQRFCCVSYIYIELPLIHNHPALPPIPPQLCLVTYILTPHDSHNFQNQRREGEAGVGGSHFSITPTTGITVFKLSFSLPTSSLGVHREETSRTHTASCSCSLLSYHMCNVQGVRTFQEAFPSTSIIRE